MKKKLLFILINMNVGGTERALLNMLEELDAKTYDITLLMLEEYGKLLKEVPEHVEKKYVHDYSAMKEVIHRTPAEVVKNKMKTGDFFQAIVLFFLFFMTKLFGHNRLLFHYVLKNVPPIKDTYDIAVAYAGPMDFISFFLVHKINAKKKVQWIHFDVANIGFNVKLFQKLSSHFDHVITVSEKAKESLLTILPTLKEKTEVIGNMIPRNKLEHKSRLHQGFTDQFNGIRILTVGRLAHEKGQDIAIRACKMLVDAGFNVKWYFIGDGKEKTNYKMLIEQYGLEKTCLLLGGKGNPYPYMKQCDIYVQPSRHEGYCLTVKEAKLFHRPIVTTNTAASEQIVHGQTGLVVRCNEEEIFEAVKQLIEHPPLKETFSNNLRTATNSDDVERKLAELFHVC